MRFLFMINMKLWLAEDNILRCICLHLLGFFNLFFMGSLVQSEHCLGFKRRSICPIILTWIVSWIVVIKPTLTITFCFGKNFPFVMVEYLKRWLLYHMLWHIYKTIFLVKFFFHPFSVSDLLSTLVRLQNAVAQKLTLSILLKKYNNCVKVCIKGKKKGKMACSCFCL